MPESSGRRTITPQDLNNFKFVHSPNISRDGKEVLFVLSQTNGENEYSSGIWKYSVENKELFPLIDLGLRALQPRWSSSGNKILYIVASSGKQELWVSDAGGYDRRKIISINDRKLVDPKWSADGNYIYFFSDFSFDGDKQKSSDVKIITRRFYRSDGEGYQHDRRMHVFRAEINAAEPRITQITSGSFDVVAFDISPDGSEIAFVANVHKEADFQNNVDIFTIPSTGGSLRKIHANKGPIAALSYSPNGMDIAFIGDDYRFKFNTPLEVWVFERSTGNVVNISHELDRAARNSVVCDVSMDDSTIPPIWKGEEEIIFVATDRGRCNIYSANARTKHVKAVTSGDHLITSQTISRDGTIAYVKMDPVHLPELYISDKGGERQVTNFNGEFLSHLILTSPREFTFRAQDGIEVHGFFYQPALKQENTLPPPCIVQIHGGGGTEGFQFMHELQCQAAQGFAIITCNFRGTQGYGEDFMRVLTGNYMVNDYSDIIDMVKYALSQGWIDPKRVGVTGGSYGGYLTNWAISHDGELFAAAVTDRSVVNLYSFYGTSDDYRLIEEDVQVSFPWDRPEHYIAKSPIGHTKNINTPLLIIHSEQDYRCPLEQAEQLYSFLIRQGKEVVLVVFPDESHGLSRGGKPHHRIERLQFNLWWFTSHIDSGTKVASPIPLPQ
jgi:dipeptidyl aminopeptidase/acylaminoacyl peptidase